METVNISFFIISFSSLFALINPLGISPILLSITENLNNEEYNRTIKKGIFFATILLLIFACMGEVIFKFYGITIHAFKIAGGILFFRTGTNMLHAKTPRTRTTPKETLEASEIEDISIAPMLFIPLVENSFKHGQLIEGKLSIDIQLKIDEDSIRFTIRNSVKSLENQGSQNGIGLTNLEKRLELLYPDHHSLSIKRNGNSFEVQLFLTHTKALQHV